MAETNGGVREIGRVGAAEHCNRHTLLAVIWLEVPQFFALLPPSAQWEVHHLYAPPLGLTDDELLTRIAEASERESSLANRVGKHWSHVSRLYSAYKGVVGEENWPSIRFLVARDLAAMTDPDLEGDGNPILVHPVVRPEPDLHKLAHALRELAEPVCREGAAGESGDRAA